jgi:PAP2 superfamily
VLALVNFAMMDGGFACFEAKYHFRFWRPYTAIRRAAEDGNDASQADPNWLPLLWTPPEVIPPTFLIPPIPNYPSAAAVTSAAATEVLRAQFGDRIRVSVTSTTLPGVTRHFHSLTQTQQEAGMSRVYGGIHFLHAVEDGWEQGNGIGRAVARMLPPARSAPSFTATGVRYSIYRRYIGAHLPLPSLVAPGRAGGSRTNTGSYLMAAAYARVGKTEEALNWLEHSVGVRGWVD